MPVDSAGRRRVVWDTVTRRVPLNGQDGDVAARVGARLSDSQLATLREIAARHNLNVSDMLRKLIDLADQLASAGAGPPGNGG